MPVPCGRAVRRSTDPNVRETRQIHHSDPQLQLTEEGCPEDNVQMTLGLNKSVEERVLGCVLGCLDGARREVEAALRSSRLCFESRRR